MRRSMLPRLAPTLILSLLLAAAPPPAAGLRLPGTHAATEVSTPRAGALSRLWRFLEAAWAKAGCQIDPSGLCAQPTMDAGCEIDPSGACRR